MKRNLLEFMVTLTRSGKTLQPLTRVLAVAVGVALLPLIADAAGLNTRLPKTSLTNGTVVVKMTGTSVIGPSDTFTMQKQIFTGSTSCASGGGAMTIVSGLSAAVTDSTSLSSADSVLITPFPSSDRNGTYQSVQNPDAATINYLPGNAVCVAGFASGTKNILAIYTTAVQTMDASCSNPKSLFNTGDTVCVHVAGSGATVGSPWHIIMNGGLSNQCSSYAALPQTNITQETQNVTFTLPSSNAAIPGGCTSNNTTDIRGNWTAYLYDFSNNYKAGDQFRLHSANALADISVSINGVYDKYNQQGFPPAGYMKVPITVGNNGPDAAPNATLVTTLPLNVTFNSFTQTSGPAFTCDAAPVGQNITCTRTSFASDTYASFELLMQYSGRVNNDTMTTTATFNSNATDITLTDHTANGVAMVTGNQNVGQFICIGDITANSTSSAGAVVTFSNPFTTTAPYTGGSFAPAPPSGSVFPIGSTVVVINSVQGSGQCTFKVIVRDAQRPDLTVVKTHPGTGFARGQSGAQYTLNVSNAGLVATTGTAVVRDALPAGLLLTSMIGTGWNCNLSTVSCQRGDSLAGLGSWPPITVTTTVPYYLSISNQFTNSAFVSGGNQGNTANDQSDDIASLTFPGNKGPRIRGDFDSDGKSDILWHNDATGQNYVYRMNGLSIATQDFINQVPDLSWKIVATGDFDGNGETDILWRNTSTGQNYIYLMNGNTIMGNGVINTIADQNWRVAGTGDFNNDGKSDILWHNIVTGQNYIYYMNGLTIVQQDFVNQVPDPTWTIVGVGDFNGDGVSDILWRNTSTGQNYVYIMAGSAIGPNGVINTIADQNWVVAGLGDFNLDKKTDIVWHNIATGQTYIYFMNGLTIVQQDFVNQVPDVNWNIVAVRDFNGDGISDLLWRNSSTGQNYIYLMNGSAIGPNAVINIIADQNWKAIGK